MCHVLVVFGMLFRGSGCRSDHCMFARSIDTCRRPVMLLMSHSELHADELAWWHSSLSESYHSKQHVQPKRYWSPELSKLRDRKRFWWNLWVDNGRPREGSVFSVFNDVNKAFRRRSRYRVANQTRNAHYKLYEMMKARYMTGFWNVMISRSIQLKSSLTDSDFNSFYGDVMKPYPILVTIKHVIRKLLIPIAWTIVKLWKSKPLTLNRRTNSLCV